MRKVQAKGPLYLYIGAMKVISILAFFFLPILASAAELRIAAASDLKFALEEIAKNYEMGHAGVKLSLTFGSSGKILTQIKEGAPFALFFSADSEKPEALVQAGKAVGPAFPYALGHLALWVRNESTLKLDPGLNVLLDSSVKKIAVANSGSAPYGKIAEEALKKAELFEKVKSKLVIGENIAQTAQFIESAAADIGLIAKSLALSPALKKEGRFIDVASSLYQPLTQRGVVLKGPSEKAAAEFKEYFLGEAGRKVLAKFGLGL